MIDDKIKRIQSGRADALAVLVQREGPSGKGPESVVILDPDDIDAEIGPARLDD